VMDTFEESQELGILFDMRNGKFRLLDPVAWMVWKLCDGAHSKDDIVKEVTKVFDVSGEQASGDVTGVLDEMEAQGIIHTVDQPDLASD